MKAHEQALAAMWALAKLRRCGCPTCRWKRAQLDAFYEEAWEVLFFKEVDEVT